MFGPYLRSCLDIHSVKRLHACIIAHGLGDNIYIQSKLMNSYASCGSLAESRPVFERTVNDNVTLWNSAMVGYFKAQYFKEVLLLYANMKTKGICIDSSAITFSLKSCLELGNLEVGSIFHQEALKVSLSGDKFVGSSLIGIYSKLGKIEYAEQAFHEIYDKDKDIVAYTSMISAYAEINDQRAWLAFGMARKMQRRGLELNRVTIVSLLRVAGQLIAVKEGRAIHGYAFRRAIGHSDEIFETSLVDMYIRCGSKGASLSVLLTMEEKSIAPWNALISGLMHSGESSEALHIFCTLMHKQKIFPDSITLANVLSACSDVNYMDRVTSIHAYFMRREIRLDLILATALIDLYTRSNKLEHAEKLFHELDQRDDVLYSVMISGYLHNRIYGDAIKMLIEMINGGVRPNSVAILSLLSYVTEQRNIREGKWLHGLAWRCNFHPDIDICNQIITMYASCGFLDTARKMFNLMDKKDIVSWTSMMMGYVNNNLAYEALALFQLMREKRIRPDSVALITLLQALSHVGLIEQVKEIHGYICRTLLVRDITTINCILTTYAKCGRLDAAEALFNSMEHRFLTSWNTMIGAYGMHGCCGHVLDLFHQMQMNNQQPDELTFTSVLSSCSHAGLVEEGLQIFNSMKIHAISPREEHYSCVVDLLSRAGRIEEAYDFLNSSPLRNKVSSLSALLAACRIHRNTRLGEIIGRRLLKLEPDNPSIYTSVSSMYALSGKWNDAARLRSMPKQRGIRNVPGCSLIESDAYTCRL